MNSSLSSKLIAGLLVAVLVVGTVGVVSAVSFSGDVSERAEVNSQERIDVTLEDPFAQSDNWTVRAETDLTDATVELQGVAPGGEIVFEESGQGAVERQVDISENFIRINIQVNGAVPNILSYNYRDRGQENVTGLTVTDQTNAETLETWEIHRFTEDSEAARTAIDEANATVEEAGSDDARDRLDEAITLYDNGEFDEAIRIANDAADIAESEGQTRQMLIIVGALVAIAAAAGGIAYVLRSRQEPENKLR